MGVSLFNISDRYRLALEAYTDPDADIEMNDEAFIDTLEAIEGEFSDKAVNVAKYLLHLEAMEEAIKEVERKQKARREFYARKAARMRTYLISQMQVTGITKVDHPEMRLSLAKLPDSVLIEDESLIPDKFWHTKTERVLSKTAIKEAGGCLGAVIVKDGKRLSIR